jgi:hypothetical protein
MFLLNRLILIDSYKPGSVQEVRLDGHTNLNGVNGAGKTTLLRLIPLFFGERPGRLVPRSKVTESFAKHYLPNESSYIIFEYRRDEQTCMAVIYASPNEEGVCYRFVDKGFEPEDFLERRSDDRLYPISCRNLYKHFTHRNVKSSIQLTSCSDYRTVIQNLPHKKGQEFRNLIARYSFCQGSSGRRLKDIEKIVSGMLMRSTSFTDLREMLVNCIDENRESIDLNLQLSTLEDWHKEYRAFHHVEAERGNVEELSRLFGDLQQIEQDFGELKQRLQLLYARNEREKNTHEKSRADSAEQLAQLKKAWGQLEDTLKSDQSSVKAELEQAVRQKQVLEKERDDWQSRDIPGKQRLFARLEQIADNLQQQKADLTQLLQHVQDIDAEFKRLKAAQDKRFAEQQHGLEMQIQTIKQQAAERKAEATQIIQQQKDELQKNVEQERDTIAQAVEELQERLGILRGKMQDIQPDPALLASRETKLSQQELIQQQKSELDETLKQLDEQIRRQRTQIEQTLGEKQKQTLDKQRIEEAAGRLQQQLDADQNTLLGFLREQHSDWVNHIAKVINPELLLREDLEPALLNKANGFYGVDLNLELLSADLAADEQQIRALLQDYEHQLKQFKLSDQQSDQQLADYQNEIKKLTQRQKEEIIKCAQVKNKFEQLKEELASLKNQIDRSKLERKAELLKQEHELDDQLKQKRAVSVDLKQKANTQIAGLNQSLDEEKRRIERMSEDEIGQVRQALKALDRQQADATAQLEKQRLHSLQERQIDTGTLTALESQIERLSIELAEAEKAGQTLKDYQRWLDNEWSRYPNLLSQSSIHRQRLEQLQAQLTVEQQNYDKSRRAQEDALAQQNKVINRLCNELDTINRLLENLQNFPHRSAETVSFDPSHTLTLLQNSFYHLAEQHKNKRKTLTQMVSHFKRVLAYFPGTQPARYYASIEDEVGLDGGDRDWFNGIINWYEARYDESQRWLIMQAQTFGYAIHNYQQALDRFDRGIDSLSRKLANHIDSNIRFEKIESIQGRLLSKVKKLGYWEQLSEFTRNYEDWRRIGEGQMPDSSFADMVRLVSEQLHGKGRMEIKLVDLLELEIIVQENGRTKRASHAEELRQISSHGLSYLILCVFFIALVNMIRKEQKLNIIWPMDELKELHQMNIELLIDILAKNNITLLSAFPDPDPEVLRLFNNRYQIIGNRELLEMSIDEDYLQELELFTTEINHV